MIETKSVTNIYVKSMTLIRVATLLFYLVGISKTCPER